MHNILLASNRSLHAQQLLFISVLFIIVVLILLRDTKFTENVGDALAVDLEIIFADVGVCIEKLIPKI